MNAAELVRTVTVYRDSYGVPHVFGPTDASCVFGFAYAQVEDNFAHLEDNFIRALGRGAEVHGEEALRDDQVARALEIPRLAREEYERSTPRMRALYDAYAAGLNHFLARNPKIQPRLRRDRPLRGEAVVEGGVPLAEATFTSPEVLEIPY